MGMIGAGEEGSVLHVVCVDNASQELWLGQINQRRCSLHGKHHTEEKGGEPHAFCATVQVLLRCIAGLRARWRCREGLSVMLPYGNPWNFIIHLRCSIDPNGWVQTALCAHCRTLGCCRAACRWPAQSCGAVQLYATHGWFSQPVTMTLLHRQPLCLLRAWRRFRRGSGTAYGRRSCRCAPPAAAPPSRPSTAGRSWATPWACAGP